ncbi:hypothetical protein V8E36_004485 [Tilletia maclaganii]
MDSTEPSSSSRAYGAHTFAFQPPTLQQTDSQQQEQAVGQRHQQHVFLQPLATPRKRRRSEENPGQYYYNNSSGLRTSPATPFGSATLPPSASLSDAHTFSGLLSPASASSLSSASSTSSHSDGMHPPLAKRTQSLHRTFTAPTSALREAGPTLSSSSSLSPQQQQQQQQRPSTRTLRNVTSSTSADSMLTMTAQLQSSSLGRTGRPAATTVPPPPPLMRASRHLASAASVDAEPDDADMSLADAIASPLSALNLRSSSPRLRSAPAVSPSSTMPQQGKPSVPSSPSPSPSSPFSPATSPPPSHGLSTPWQRRFADSTVPLSTSASFPFTRRVTLGHHAGAQFAASAASVASGSTAPVFGVPTFAARTSSLSPASSTRSMMTLAPHQSPAQRRTSTSSLGHAPAFGTAFSRSLSVQDLTSATTAGLLLPVNPSHSALSALGGGNGPGTAGTDTPALSEHASAGSSSSSPSTSSGGAGSSSSGSGLVPPLYAPLRPSPLIQSHTLTAVSDSPPACSSKSSSTDSIGFGTSPKVRTAGEGPIDQGDLADVSGNDGSAGSGSTGRGGRSRLGSGESDLDELQHTAGFSTLPPFDHAEAQGYTFPFRAETGLDRLGRGLGTALDHSARWRTSAVVDSDGSDDEQMAEVQTLNAQRAGGLDMTGAAADAAITPRSNTVVLPPVLASPPAVTQPIRTATPTHAQQHQYQHPHPQPGSPRPKSPLWRSSYCGAWSGRSGWTDESGAYPRIKPGKVVLRTRARSHADDP